MTIEAAMAIFIGSPRLSPWLFFGHGTSLLSFVIAGEMKIRLGGNHNGACVQKFRFPGALGWRYRYPVPSRNRASSGEELIDPLESFVAAQEFRHSRPG